MAHLDRNGPLDTVSSAIILTFTTLWFLGFGLQVAPIETRMPAFLTLFGAVPASLTFASDLAVRGGGAMALVPILSNLPFFLGTENPIQSSSPRQLVNMAVWIGFFLINYRNTAWDGNLGGWNTAFNLNWLFTNGFFALLHFLVRTRDGSQAQACIAESWVFYVVWKMLLVKNEMLFRQIWLVDRTHTHTHIAYISKEQDSWNTQKSKTQLKRIFVHI